jgi:hypothetical protein
MINKNYFMADEKIERNKPDEINQDTNIKSDPGTVGTTDPQEHMRGPMSSLMHKIEEAVEHNDEKDIDKQKKEGKIPE